MTVASEITRLQTAKANIRTSIQSKGVTVPSSAKLDTYSTYVDQISVGADIKGLFKEVIPTSTQWSLYVQGCPDPYSTYDAAGNTNYVTYNDGNYWVFLYFCEPAPYNNSCSETDHYAVVNSFMWIVDKTNNYSVTKVSGGRKAVYYGRSSDGDFWGWDAFWGTNYFYKKGTQLKLQIYNNYASRNSTYSYTMRAYGLYDLTFDMSTKTVSNSQIYSEKRKTGYEPEPPTIPTEWEYENLPYHPDNTWTFLGSPSGNSMNRGYSGYAVTPYFVGERSATCNYSGTASLKFTA